MTRLRESWGTSVSESSSHSKILLSRKCCNTRARPCIRLLVSVGREAAMESYFAEGGFPDHEFASVLQDFIATNFEHDPKLTNLADLVAWNEAHAEEAMPEREFRAPLPLFLHLKAIE